MTNKSLLSYEIPTGKFEATITDYKEVPALLNNTKYNDPSLPENAIVRDAYIDITLRLDNGESVKTRWYSKRISYIMCCINRQFYVQHYSLRELIEYCMKYQFHVYLSIDPKYGLQVEYESK